MLHRPTGGVRVAAIAFALISCAFASLQFTASVRAVEHVIHVSVDGLHAGHLQKEIDAGNLPTFKRLQDEGAWTTNARADFTHTVTLPNHTSMLTGRPVEQPEGMPETVCHGYTLNDMPPHGATLHNTGNPRAGYISSAFDVVHDAGMSTALYTSKDKFAIYEQSYNETTGAENAHGRKKLDLFVFHDDGPPTFCGELNRRFLTDMAFHRFNYAFVHYRDTDSVGHMLGWGGTAWRQTLRSVDGYLADVLRLVESDPKLAGQTVIIVTTDHGGVGLNHGESELADNYTIPLFVWGSGVDHGDLYAMNAVSRGDPGDSRPDYNTERQPIRNGDSGNLALSLLGLGPVPGSLINAQQDLRVTNSDK